MGQTFEQHRIRVMFNSIIYLIEINRYKKIKTTFDWNIYTLYHLSTYLPTYQLNYINGKINFADMFFSLFAFVLSTHKIENTCVFNYFLTLLNYLILLLYSRIKFENIL